MATTAPGIFLSHTSADKRFVRKLGARLQENGVRVWVDEAEIRVGESLIEKISQGIRDMDYLAVVLTPKSVTAPWVKKELNVALTREISGKLVSVLPVLHKDCEIPVFLADKLYADFRNPRAFEKSLAQLLERVLPGGFKEHILEAVRAAMTAEFDAYKALPGIKADDLERHFLPTGSAYRRITHLLQRHAKRGWVLNNDGNPSTIELIDAKVEKISRGKAHVFTEEYWYLRWYDPVTGKYKLIYNKRNQQRYVLRQSSPGRWKIETNIYPLRKPTPAAT